MLSTGRPRAPICSRKDGDYATFLGYSKRLLDLKEVDVVAIGTPDHWHAKMSINDHAIEEVIRGKTGIIRFATRDGQMGYEVLPQNVASGPGRPKTGNEGGGGKLESAIANRDTTPELWDNFLKCVRAGDRKTLSTPELGAAAFTTVAMGVQSYRQGVALFWDKDARKPVPADETWAKRWEERSKKHGTPNQVKGWTAGTTGSTLEPEDYQKLGGAWVNGKDPAEGGAVGGGN